MIVDPSSSMVLSVGTLSNQFSIERKTTISSSIELPLHRLTKSNNRCVVCGEYFTNNEHPTFQIGSYIKTRALIEHDILIMTPARCCVKHISNDYFTVSALQLIQSKEKMCETSLEELKSQCLRKPDEIGYRRW